MNFLVKLSRNTKVMVPLVIVIGVSIFGGGALINNQQKIARTSSAEQSQPTDSTQQVAETEQPELTQETTVEQLPEEQPADEAATTEDSDQTAVNVVSTVSENNDGTVNILATLDTKQQGLCTTIINDTQFSAVAKDGTCEFKNLSVPVDANKLKIVFEAEDSEQTGSTSTEVN